MAGKDLRLLRRDTRSVIILLIMPLIFVAVLGMAVGEGFGQKPDDRLRISVLNLDSGLPKDAIFPNKPWSEVVIEDLSSTADIRIEVIETREQAEQLIRSSKRSAVLIFEPEFSERMHRCSFLTKTDPPPLNPLYRDGINVQELGLTIQKDPTQAVASSIIEQVAQVTLLRVVIPWMIGKAFEKVGDENFMALMAEEVPLMRLVPSNIRKEIGPGVQKGISKLFSNYNFTAKTWAGLTKSEGQGQKTGTFSVYNPSEGSGLLKRGAIRYQILVPSYTVMFAFFLVLTVGWLFVAERRHGTLVRLRAAPITRGELLFGKLIPCFLMSIFQGFFLLLAGRFLFGMTWGSEPWGLIPIVLCTSLAATGLAMLVAGFAKTETQVAVYGTLLVLTLAGLSGSLMPRDLMPEPMRYFSYITPHAWALDAYSQLLTNPSPEWAIIAEACLYLVGFAVIFLLLAWLLIRLDES